MYDIVSDSAVEIYLNAIKVQVPRMSYNLLVLEACEEYNYRSICKSRGCNKFNRATPDGEKPFIERITLNYLPHQLSKYDRYIDDRRGKTFFNEIFIGVNKMVYNAISCQYPMLSEACDIQLKIKIEKVADEISTTAKRKVRALATMRANQQLENLSNCKD